MDREEKLARLKQARETAAAEKELADRLRDELIKDLEGEGQVFFVDADGVKRRAYYSESDATKIDLEELRACVTRHELRKDVYDEIIKIAPDLEKIKHAIATGRIPQAVVAKTMKVIPGGKSKTIKFGDPSDATSS